MFWIGLILAIFVGLTLGMIGSGGSILTVPILVYIFGVHPVLATTYSLLIIGIISLVGGTKGILNKTVDLNKVLYFGLPSMITVFLVRTFILPLIPDQFIIGDFVIYQDKILMILFAVIMIFSAIPMIKGETLNFMVSKSQNIMYVIMQGVIVGVVTGVVGAGGGFLIIPVLINSFGLTLKRAVSTSLVLITINSFIGFLGDIEKLSEFDWTLVAAYVALSVVGLFIGFSVSDRIDNAVLKKGFGIGILCLSLFMLVQELLFN